MTQQNQMTNVSDLKAIELYKQAYNDFYDLIQEVDEILDEDHVFNHFMEESVLNAFPNVNENELEIIKEQILEFAPKIVHGSGRDCIHFDM